MPRQRTDKKPKPGPKPVDSSEYHPPAQKMLKPSEWSSLFNLKVKEVLDARQAILERLGEPEYALPDGVRTTELVQFETPAGYVVGAIDYTSGEPAISSPSEVPWLAPRIGQTARGPIYVVDGALIEWRVEK